MRYYSSKELNAEKREEAIGRLSNFSGPMVRLGSAFNIFEKYRTRYFTDKNVRVLDCGSASGGFLKQLCSCGFQNLYGVDLDNYLSKENKRLLSEFKTADLSYEKMPWPDGFFSILTAWCLVPHLENPHNFFREAKRVLKDDGLLLVSIVNVSSGPNRRFFLRNGDFPGYHKNNNHIAIITPSIFAKTVLRDFDLVGVEHFINPRTFTGWKGKIRGTIFRWLGKLPSIRAFLEDRWAPKIVYILRKKIV